MDKHLKLQTLKTLKTNNLKLSKCIYNAKKS